ncbi:MAG: hypothetical protein M3443_18155 [Actinomycetota bacterium]|nr:hypothetical protein [Actinomycetota bacterium]
MARRADPGERDASGELSEAGRAAILEMANRVREIERSAGKSTEHP